MGHSSPEQSSGGLTTVRVVQRIAASRARIWRACSDPDELARWQVDAASGRMEVGGRVLLSWPSLRLSTHVEVVECEHEQRLALRHGVTTARFEVGPGMVSLTQTNIPPGDPAEGIASSWRVSLATLRHYLEQHPDSERHVSWFVSRARTRPETAHVFFTDPVALSSWLTQTGSIGEEGSRCTLRLAWGEALHGRVLANTEGRDVALSWDDRDGSVLSLRTLPVPDNDDERLLALAWSCWGTPADEGARAELRVAMARLKQALDHDGAA